MRLAIVLLIVALMWALPASADTAVYGAGPGASISNSGVKITNPYVSKANAYKGQLHTHSNNSLDAVDTPEEVMNAYKAAGYDFVSITDHNVSTADPGVSGILFIRGAEETHTKTGWHVNSYGVTSQTDDMDFQDVIDYAKNQGGLVQINHPGTTDTDSDVQISTATLLGVYGYYAIEIRNEALEYAARLDTLLRQGYRLWGVAVDDCHDVSGAGFNQGWVVVYADSLTQTDILDSMHNGNFYSSTGPDMTITLSDYTLSVATSSAATITWYKNNRVAVRTVTSSTADSYTVRGDEQFIMIEITRNSDSEKAYSNPIFVHKGA